MLKAMRVSSGAETKIAKTMIRDAAQTYLNTARYVEVTLFPEKKTEPFTVSDRRAPVEPWRPIAFAAAVGLTLVAATYEKPT